MNSTLSRLEPEAFEQQLRDCLSHYYDYAFLQDHSLVRLLIPNVRSDVRRVQNFRELVEQAIDSLKPGLGGDAFSRQARFHNILLFRYINQQQVQHVLYRLNLGERQFYRDHNKAIQALGRILLKQAEETYPAPDNSISIQSEIQRIHNVTRPEPINVRTFLQKTLVAVQSLIEAYHSTVRLQVDDQRLLLVNDETVLRQTIIWLLSQFIIQAGPGSQFTLAFLVYNEEGQFIFTCEKVQQPIDLSFLEPQETLHNLVQALDGQIKEENSHGGDCQINLTIPLRKHAILIIDDNPDVVALFRRYLIGYPYLALTAEDGDAALRVASASLPELIVLDVLLPRQDGWEILQNLKSHRPTRHIPVVVCSVLDSPELAHTLGADGFLRKPPGETEFRDMLARLISAQTGQWDDAIIRHVQ